LGSQLTIENVVKDSPIFVYNQAGVRVHSAIATGDSITLNLQFPAGVYLIQIGDRTIRVVVN